MLIFKCLSFHSFQLHPEKQRFQAESLDSKVGHNFIEGTVLGIV